MVVVDRWLLFRGHLCNKSFKWGLKMVVVTESCSQLEVVVSSGLTVCLQFLHRPGPSKQSKQPSVTSRDRRRTSETYLMPVEKRRRLKTHRHRRRRSKSGSSSEPRSSDVTSGEEEEEDEGEGEKKKKKKGNFSAQLMTSSCGSS